MSGLCPTMVVSVCECVCVNVCVFSSINIRSVSQLEETVAECNVQTVARKAFQCICMCVFLNRLILA